MNEGVTSARLHGIHAVVRIQPEVAGLFAVDASVRVVRSGRYGPQENIRVKPATDSERVLPFGSSCQSSTTPAHGIDSF